MGQNSRAQTVADIPLAELRAKAELDFGQKFNGLAIVARQFLYGHGQAEAATKSRCIHCARMLVGLTRREPFSDYAPRGKFHGFY
jgi:hypothetical protein